MIEFYWKLFKTNKFDVVTRSGHKVFGLEKIKLQEKCFYPLTGYIPSEKCNKRWFRWTTKGRFIDSDYKTPLDLMLEKRK